jgi:putative transcription factor
MKAACEVCGSPLRASPNRVEIDGAVMIVCGNCSRLGKQLGPAVPVQVQAPFRARPPPMSAPRLPSKPIEVEFEVDPEYNVKIKQAREKLGLSQERLGQLLNEKPSLIRMVESKKLKPDLPLTRKFMHQLKINLLVSLSELEGGRPTGI